MNELVKNITQDIFSFLGIPTNTIGCLIEKKKIEGREILLGEIRQGDFTNIKNDELLSILARYERDVIEGVAKNNLKLMGEVINGMIFTQKLRADVFCRYAPILAVLTEEEIKLLGIMAKENHNSYTVAIPNLVEKHKYKKSECETIFQSLIRTGLVIFKQEIVTEGYTDITPSSGRERSIEVPTGRSSIKTDYILTPLMEEILSYVIK
tara:strand:- start:7611 stop:8237 length:627 start_codon:yes stop_codon:yes gene_type:complete